MIAVRHLQEMLQAKPFRPFRIFLSDGSAHEVPHPEFAWIFRNRIFVGTAANGSARDNDAVQELSLLHITRVQKLAKPAGKTD